MSERSKLIAILTVCSVLALVAVAKLLPVVATGALFAVCVSTMLMVREIYGRRESKDD